MRTLLALYPGDRVVVALVTVLVLASCAILLAWLLARFLARRNAALRFLFFLAALVVSLSGPMFLLVTERLGVESVRVPLSAPIERAPLATPAAPESGARARPTAVEGATPVTLTGPERTRAILAGALLMWLLGTVLLGLRLLHGSFVLARLRRGLRPVPGGLPDTILGRVRKALGVADLPPILVSGDVGSPLSAGLMRPSVVLPERLPGLLNEEEMEDVLTHECAHVVHRDPWIGLLQRVAQMVYWPLPLIHALNRRLSMAREEICDNYVLRRADPAVYARNLVNLAERTSIFQRLPVAAGLVHPRWRMEERIRGIMDKRRILMTRANTWATASVAAMFVAMGVLVAGSRPSQAEENPERLALLCRTANDDSADKALRCAAIFQVWADHVRPGAEAERMGEIFETPTWLERAKVREIEIVGGVVPVEMGGDATVFQLHLFPDEKGVSDWVIWLRLSGTKRPEAAVLGLLRGDAEAAQGTELEEFALWYPNMSFDRTHDRVRGVSTGPRFEGIVIDAIEVSEEPGRFPSPRKVQVATTAEIERLLDCLRPQEIKPSGGENRYELRLLVSGVEVYGIWVFDYGEWGYRGRSRGLSNRLPDVLELLLEQK